MVNHAIRKELKQRRRRRQNNNVKWPNFRFSRTRAHDSKFFFRFLCFNTVRSNLGPGQLASICHVKQIGIIAKELQKRRREFIYSRRVCGEVAVATFFRTGETPIQLFLLETTLTRRMAKSGAPNEPNQPKAVERHF